MIQHGRERTAPAAGAMLRLAAALVIISALTASAFARESQAIKVERVSFPVTLSDGHTYQVAGYLYYQGSFRNRTLLLALHGGNYNHKYWDVPEINGHEYSFARYMAARKYAVLAIDQLGTGESDKPQGDLVTLDNTAGAIHQAIGSLRSGANGVGYAFGRVVLVGHSLGSINAIYEQGTYADALITTGIGPVLAQFGEHDALFPPSLAAAEPAFYASASGVTVQSVPGVGHDVNTHYGNHASWRLMDEWLQAQRLGRPGGE